MLIGTLAALAFVAQGPVQGHPSGDSRPTPPPVIAGVTDTSAVATRAELAPVIDGKDDDRAWAHAPVISGFREWRPTEGKDARFRTEAKVVYDAANLYVFVRAYDPHPDSIARLLGSCASPWAWKTRRI